MTWAGFTAYMFVASFKTSRAVNVVFGLLLLTFLALGIGELAASTGLTKLGGYLGLATAAAGAYARHGGDHQCDVRSHRPPDPPAGLSLPSFTHPAAAPSRPTRPTTSL